MKRALRLIYGGPDSSASENEISPLLSANDGRQNKTTLYQLRNQALQSLTLLSRVESSSEASASVKFTTNRYIPISFLRSLMQMLDPISLGKLYCTSKSFKIAIKSQRANIPSYNMPIYCIDSVQLSEKIQQQQEDCNGELMNEGQRRHSTPHALGADDSSDNSSDDLTHRILQYVGYLFVVVLLILGSIFLLQHNFLHVRPFLYIMALLLAAGICYVWKRRQEERDVLCQPSPSHRGYDAV